MATRLIDDLFDALDEQTVTVPGTGTLDIVIPSLVRSLAAVHEQRRALETQINTLLEAHPLSQVLTSMPGVGFRTAFACMNADPASRTYYDKQRARRKTHTQALLARQRISVLFAMLRDGTLYEPRTPTLSLVA